MLIKKITAIAASAALVFGTLCFSANAASPEEDFIISGSCITGYKGNGGDVVIPDGIDEIDFNAFGGNGNITSLVIPKGCTRIGEGAFNYCTALKSVTFEGDMEEIGGLSFYACTALERVTFKGNVIDSYPNSGNTGLGWNSFMGCKNLKAVEFAPNSQVDTIKRAAFLDCASLSEVKLPNTVGFISDHAFSNCPELTRLEIPSMTVLGEFAAGYMYDEPTEDIVKADGIAAVQADIDLSNGFQTLEEVCQKPITLVVAPNSPAEKYAKENDIAYEYKTTADANSPAEGNPQTGGNDLPIICFTALFSLSLILFVNKKTA